MKAERFEDLLVWQRSKELVKAIYVCFADSRDFSFKDQIQRAAVSVMNNIAEGFERKSNNEFKYFLYVSKGSCAEVRSMLVLALELKKISPTDYEKLYQESVEISKMISGLIKTL